MSFGCKVCPKSFQLLTDLLKHFKVHVHPGTNNQKEKTFTDGTPDIKCENKSIGMDIDGTAIKVKPKPPLPQIQKLSNGRKVNANQEKHFVESKSENQLHDHTIKSQKDMSSEEVIDIKFENEESSYFCGKKLNSKKKSLNTCEICKKSFQQSRP